MRVNLIKREFLHENHFFQAQFVVVGSVCVSTVHKWRRETTNPYQMLQTIAEDLIERIGEEREAIKFKTQVI